MSAAGFRLTVDGTDVDGSVLRRMADRLAHDLVAAGAVPGHGVLAPPTNSVAFVAAERACRSLGCTLVLHAKFADTRGLPLVAEIAETAGGPLVKAVGPRGDRRFPQEAAVASYTSGSSGEPRLVLLTHEGQRYQYRATAERLEIGPDDSLCLPLPLNHAYGFSVLGVARTRGARLCLEQGCDIATLITRVSSRRVTTLDGVPGMYAAVAHRIRRDSAAVRAFAALRVRGCGGELLPQAVEDTFTAVDAPLHNGYGLTEAGPNVALNGPGSHAPRSVGRPLAGTDVRADPATGELLVRGPGLMAGYFEPGGAPAADGGWLRTGDLGAVRDGWVHVDGRLGERITVSGETVIPGHLEALLSHRHGAARVGVLAVRDRRGTARLAAVIEATADFDRDAWVRWSRRTLPPHLRFREVHQVRALPLLDNGKVDRTAVRAFVEHRSQAAAHA